LNQLAFYLDALKCGVAGWMKIWGEPFLSGTVFVASYAVVAVLILKVARQTSGRELCLWRVCGFALVFQALNTNLDLHAFPGTFGRCLAYAQGWYENRQQVQIAFLSILGISVILLLLIASIYFYQNISSNILLISGVAIALGITIIKGITYHGAEQIYDGDFGQFRGADLIEFSGILIALAAALMRSFRIKRNETGGI
jgi:hypothetical protein